MLARTEKTRHPGVYFVHRRSCTVRGEEHYHEGQCACPKAYQAVVSVFREGKRGPVRKHFVNITAAKDWRNEAASQEKAGTFVPRTKLTLWDASQELIAGMEDDSVLDASRRPYKPSTKRSYEQALRIYVLPELGQYRLTDIDADMMQGFIERLRTKHELKPSSVRNVLCPVQAIYRRHRRRVPVNPTVGLDVEAAHGSRRVDPPSTERARALIDAAPEEYRALWATAFYAGLRRGELQALRWGRVDFEQRTIHVECSWDQKAGEVDVKTEAGRRKVPIPDRLRRELAAHKLRTGGRGDDDLVFGRRAREAFVPSTVREQTLEAWKAAGLEPVTLHEARHCAVSFGIEAKLSIKALSVYAGHSDVRITINRYGHLMEDAVAQDAERLSRFLDKASG